MIATILFALLNQATDFKEGGSYRCQIVGVKSATQVTLKIDGVAQPKSVSLSGLQSAPQTSWAYEAGREFLIRFYRNTSIELRVRKSTKNVVEGDLYVSRFPLAVLLIDYGFARVSSPSPAREKIQAKAREAAVGMWTTQIPKPKIGDQFIGAVVKVFTPTTFQVMVDLGDNFNSSPTFKVRIWGLRDPPSRSEAFRSAMSASPIFPLDGKVEIDWSSGRRRTNGYETLFSVHSLDRDGSLVCSASCELVTDSLPQGGYGYETYSYAERLISFGWAMIDQKVDSIPEAWRIKEANAKAAKAGVWAKP